MTITSIQDARSRRDQARPEIIQGIRNMALRAPDEIERELLTEWIAETRDLLLRIETVMKLADAERHS